MGFLRERSDGVGRSSDALVGAFGKLPKLSEFVRFRMSGEPMHSFETWLEHAMGWGASHKGDMWASAYGDGLIHAFVYRPPYPIGKSHMLVGVIGPSTDAVGRKFPFVVFTPLSQDFFANRPNLIPLALGDFLEEATLVLLESGAVTSVASVQDRVQQISSPSPEALDVCDRDYDAWARRMSISQVWSALYDDPLSWRPLHAIHTIYEALSPFRGRERPNTPLSVRLPLGVGGAAASAFWIDVIRSVGKWQTTVPTVFWSSDGISGSVLIQLGDVPASSLAELWLPDPDSDYVCDLTIPSSVDRNRFLGRLPSSIARALESPDILVIDFLNTLMSA